MSSLKKQCGALFLNFALLANQVGAELQMITFEATEWMPAQSVSGHANWFLDRGTALVSADGQGNSGGKALRIPAGLEDQTHVRRQLDWSASEPTAFVDFFIKPSAEAGGSLASVHLNGAQLSFLKNAAGDGGAVWVYSGNDYSTDAEAWRETPATFGLNAAGTASNRYLRVTVRQDYVRDIWDVFVDGTLVAANLGFEGRNGFIRSIDFFNGEASDNFVDDLQALPGNMLFPDQDKDGLPDAWEIANGSNPNLYDRDFKPDGNKSFLESYMESLTPGSPVVTGRGVTPPAGVIPPLSLPAHQAVGSLKGSLAVGADGAASYSIPIDLPKGTAGMEPKLSLDYSSRGGNGLLGLGWSLGGLQTITRGPSTFARDGQFDPADFDANDRFFLNGQRLVCVGGGYGNPGSVYRTEIDSYARITAHGVGPSHWTVETKSGLKMTFGNSPDSRLSSPKGAMAWSVNEVQDTVGNYYTVNYHGAGEYGGFDEASHRVASIHYTGNTNVGTAPYIAVVFSYEDRPDIARAFSDNYGRLASKRLSKITVSTNGRINHSYRLGYVTSYQSGRSLISAVTKHIDDSSSSSLTVPATTFTYDGIRPEEDLWQNPGGDPLPVFGTGLDATAAVNSMVDVQESDPTMIRLYGDVARAVPLPEGQITLQSDTRINFEFRSLKQGGGGAFIGVDADTAYQSQATSALFRIGGTGIVTLADGQTFTNNTQPYTVSDWKTFDFNLGQFGVGTVRKYLVLMCVDNNVTDGADCAFFRNVRIYRSGTQTPATKAPIQFEAGTSLPRFSDILGRDLGVKVLDLNSDGLPDLADWRVVDYAVDTSSGPRKLIPQTTGYAYLNTGSAFEMNLAIRPGAHQPLGCRQTTENAWGHVSKHQLLATPVDVDMDGSLDLLSPVNLIADPDGTLRNDYTFFSWKNGAWTENPAWTLPFRVSNLGSSDTHGGKPRTVHFEWMDLNQDGYPDLVIHTTSPGKLVDRFNGTQLLGGNSSIAYLNRGHAGTGWIRADEYALPVPLMQIEKDPGRRIVDVDGDGLPEIVESVATAELTSRTYRLKTSGTYRWNSLPGGDPPPADPYDLPAALAHTDGSATGTVLADLNGDGLPDLLKANRYATSNDFMAWINRGTSRYNPGPPPSGTRPWGLTEAVATDAASRAASYRLDYPLHVSNDNQMIPYGFQMADLNGDGLIDILYADIDNPNSTGPDNTAILNTGNGWSLRPEWGMPGNQRIFYSAAERNARQRSARLEDINGDGFPDLINGLLDRAPRVWLNNCRPEVLTAVTDGFGSNLTVDYRRLNDSTPSAVFGMPTYLKGTNLPASQSAIIDARPVVYRYSQPNGSGGTHWHHLRYEDLRYDNKNATSLGFRVIVRQDVAAGQRVTTINSTEYPFAGSPLEVFTEALQTDQQIASLNPPSSPVVGNENISAGWKKLTHEWAAFNDISEVPGIRRPCQTWGLKLHYNPTPVLLGRTETSQTFDQMGFVTSSTVSSLDGSQVVTANTYAHRTNSFTDSHGTVDRWHIGRLITSDVTKSGAGQSSVTRHSVFTYDDRTGLLKSEEIEPGNALSSKKDYTYDDFGNIEVATVTARAGGEGSSLQTRSIITKYDSRGRFVEAETNGLNHRVSYLHDEGRALLDSVTDANGLTTTYQYDAFGTRTFTLHPDGTRTGEITGYASAHPLPSAVSGQINGHIPLFIRATQTSGGPVTMVWLDLLGREIATETTILANVNATGNADHRKVYTVSHHNWRGLKTAVSQPFAVGETPKFTSITYDYLSRPLRTIHPDGAQDRVTGIFIDFVDGGPCNRTNSVSRNSQTLERWEDQHGRLVQSRDASGKITRFKHDLDGRLIQVSLDGQILLTNKFDTFGNKTEVWEANSGTSTSTYNGFGEVVTSTNARGQQTTTTYDTLGRVETITRPNGEGTYTYQYDSAPGAGVGQVHHITGPDGYRDEFAYDFKGRPIRSVASRPNPDDGPAGRLETFTTFTTYDALGRVHSTTDAGGLTTLHAYDSHTSALVSLSIGPGASGAGTTLWHAGTYDSQGKPLTQTLAHGITRSASYFTLTGLINTLGASMGGQAVQSLTVTWENEGNLLSRSDGVSGKTETFGYDSLNRLTSATIAGGASSGYSYDIKGNLISKPGATLAYEGTRPHAVSSATLKGVAHTYQYDAAGYMTGDFVNGTLRRSFAWTSYGQLRRLDYTAAPALHRLSGGLAYGPADVRCDFLHDASGSRYLQRKLRTAPDASRVTEETFYLGSYERERHFTGTSSVPDRTVHRHSIGGFAVYTRTVESTGSQVRLSTILKDHLGSTDVIITGRWVATTFGEIRAERQSFDPWGERRDPSTLALFRQSATDPFRTSSEDHDRGYTGHEQLDDSGLIHMNGRIYDPELGRMLSPDPFVQVPEYSQNFNRYSYVLNNPLNKTDPSGYSWLSEAFDKVGDWFSENWRTVVVWVAVAVMSYFGVPLAFSTAIGNGLGTALNGGSASDIARSAAVGFAQGAAGAWAGDNTGTLGKIAITASSAGLANEALGGKFQDGFLSSLKYQAIMTSAELAGRMLRSSMTQDNISGIGDVSTEEHEMLYKAGYDLHAQRTLSGTVDPSRLDLPPGWEFVEFYRNYEESYLDYAIFENSAKGIRLMNFVGTQNDGGLFGDWLDNFAQGFGFRSKQYMKAIEFALLEQSNAANDGMKFVLNGHSLGGGLAAAASAVTGSPAAIYNAAGLNPMTLRHAGFADRIPSMGQNIVHYGVGGEVLTALEYSLFFMPRPTATNYYTWAPAAPQSAWDLSPIEWHRPAITMRSIP